MRARFGQYEVELSSGDLRRSGVPVRIQEHPLQVLRLLLEAEGRVVTREQLQGVLWPEDTFVDFEHGVNTTVKKLRRALGDTVENPQFIETLPEFGYRFIAPVEWVGDSGTAISCAVLFPLPSQGRHRILNRLLAKAKRLPPLRRVRSLRQPMRRPLGKRHAWCGGHSVQPAFQRRSP